jgi:hypothetical protein
MTFMPARTSLLSLMRSSRILESCLCKVFIYNETLEVIGIATMMIAIPSEWQES